MRSETLEWIWQVRTVIGQEVETTEAAVKHQETVLKSSKEELAAAWGDSGKLKPLSVEEVIGFLDFETLRHLHDEHETQKAIIREIEKKLALIGKGSYPVEPMVVQRFSAKVVE